MKSVKLKGKKDEDDCANSVANWDILKCEGCTTYIDENLPITYTNTTTETKN